MRRLLPPGVLGFALALAVGCGSTPLSGGGGGHAGSEAGGGGQAGSAGNTGSAGRAGAGGATGGSGGSAAGSSGHDDCHADGDCPQGVCSGPPCSELLCALGNDGFHHCTPRTPPTLASCDATNTNPCCRSDADCTTAAHGHCLPFSLGSCGGPAPRPGNQCLYDACAADADCTAQPNGVCTAGYPRSCLYSVCHANADCTAGPGGRCALASVGSIYCSGDAVFCRYSTDPCASNGDCPGTGSGFGRECVPVSGGQGTVCKDVPPPPP